MANQSWIPSKTRTLNADVIVDSNGNVQQCTESGASGTVLPVFGTSVGATTHDGSVVWTCVAVLAGTTLPAELISLPPPVFINDADGLDPQLILDDMVAEFEASTGRTLYPAQIEQLLINLYAFREALIRNVIQYAGQQSLLAFANFPNVDYLGALVGVERLRASGALTTLQFTLVDGPRDTPYFRDIGVLVGTQDGAVQFITTAPLLIPIGQPSSSIGAQCTTPGVAGNGYAPGKVNVLLVPDTAVTVANTTLTADGAPIESTDKLRARIQLAPNRFSVAGPAASYRFFALSVDPTIQDVNVTTPVPGQVIISVLGTVTQQPAASGTQGVVTQPLLDLIAQKVGGGDHRGVTGEDVRPLTDTVTVVAATEVDYEVNAAVTLMKDAVPSSVEPALISEAVAFALRLARRTKQDIVPEEWIAVLGSVGGVYRVQVASPEYTQLLDGQWANCTAVTLTILNQEGLIIGTLTP